VPNRCANACANEVLPEPELPMTHTRRMSAKLSRSLSTYGAVARPSGCRVKRAVAPRSAAEREQQARRCRVCHQPTVPVEKVGLAERGLAASGGNAALTPQLP
jgi:hypothetical protein